MSSSIRMYSWLLLAGLVSVTLGQSGYSDSYIPPPPGGTNNGGNKACPPQVTSYQEVVRYVTHTQIVPQVRRTTLVQYSTVTVIRYSPSYVYRTVTNTDFRRVTSVSNVAVTVTQQQEVVRKQVQPDTTVKRVVTVATSSIVYRDVVKTEYQTRNIVNTVTQTVTETSVVRLTYSQPPAVIRTIGVTVTGPAITQHVTKTIFNNVVSRVYAPAVTNTVRQVNTQTIETTRTVVKPGKTVTVTQTVNVPQQKIIYKSEIIPQYVSSTHVQIKQELKTVNSVVLNTVKKTQVRYTTKYQQQVQQSVLTVPVKSTSYQERIVTNIVTQPGATSTKYQNIQVYRTVQGPRVTSTSVRVSNVVQQQLVTVTVTSTQLSERLHSKYVKDCGGYNYKAPRHQLSLAG